MPERPKTPGSEISRKQKAIGLAASLLIRAVCATMRWEMRDNAGIVKSPPDIQMIWTFWHNRVFAVPILYRKYLRSRSGAVLTSPSNDGTIIATTMKCFGVDAVRGSSSRGGLKALLSLKKWIDNGFDVAITPDGPRGPRYILAPGLILLAQKTQAAILPIRVEYSSFWRLKSWDQFQIPKPFSKVTVTFEPLQMIGPDLDEAGFEEARERVEKILNPARETE
ncbi:MAG: lysophospholipid acyltransferase family protein [Verrucomicrobiales bacterium]|nr:lysophospholipid acyltransferase family protein [Verrucomicrobiales bacterium]